MLWLCDSYIVSYDFQSNTLQQYSELQSHQLHAAKPQQGDKRVRFSNLFIVLDLL